MPELAEVECMRRRWDVALGQTIKTVDVHARARIFRGHAADEIAQSLRGARLAKSERSGKRMAFHFRKAGWLGIHLGMTGELRVVSDPDVAAGRHDHLVLRLAKEALVYNDPRMFGAILFSAGDAEPEWWRDRPPEIVDARFTAVRVAAFLQRRARAPIKAVLLMQEMFPGIGNWMADEVLWRARILPARAAGSLNKLETAALHRALRFVCRGALRTIAREKNNGTGWSDPPDDWLFHQRWSDGGRCPRTGVLLKRAAVGGRTTCWSPAWQR